MNSTIVTIVFIICFILSTIALWVLAIGLLPYILFKDKEEPKNKRKKKK